MCLRDPIFKFRDPGPPAKPFVEGITDSGGINTVVSCYNIENTPRTLAYSV